jgi:CPA1 family monovalent cation:H+ antiporter
VHEFELVLVLLAVVTLIAFASRMVTVPYPILMVIGGLVISLVPALPRVELDPEIVLVTFLPPILFAGAYFTSIREFWRSIRPITLLAVGLVVTTTLVVAGVSVLLVPTLGFAAALALGAIVSPPDAIAVTAIAQRVGLPRRVVTILEGESLVNDATALVLYGFAVAAVQTGAFSLGDAAVRFVWVAAVGIGLGVVVGVILVAIERRLTDPPVEVMVSILAPYGTYLLAESAGASGVLSTVVAGAILGWHAPRVMTSDTRILASGVWQMLIFLVNGLAFLLIGLQMPRILEVVSERHTTQLIGLAAAICLTVIAVRMAWVFPATYIPRIVVPGLARRDPAPPARVVAVIGWAGMRGAVSLAAALALPLSLASGAPFPERDLILFLTFSVILVTLVGQGLTLPWLVRRAGIGDDGSSVHEEVHARQAANDAALGRLEGLQTEWPGHVPLIEQLRQRYEHAEEHLVHDHAEDGRPAEPEMDQEAIEHLAIRRAVLDAQRLAVIDLRDRGIIHDDVMRRIERELDLEELQAER